MMADKVEIHNGVMYNLFSIWKAKVIPKGKKTSVCNFENRFKKNK